MYEEIVIREGPAVLCAELAERHSHKLPVVVELSCSLYGLCEDLTLTAGDKISLHFLKKTECARIAGKYGQVLSVPINSSLRFSPLCEGTEECNMLNFDSVKKLVLAKPHPLVVCVTITKECDPESNKSAPSVAIGDVLVLKDNKRRTFREGHVQCFNTRSNQEFGLNEDCGMHFTMNSELTKLSLSLLLKHVNLPQRCSVHAEENAKGAELRLLRRVFHDRICTVLSPALETSFIASYQAGNLADEKVLEIATDFDVPVHMIKPGSSTQNLVDRTSDIFQSFHPRMVTAFISSSSDNSNLNMLALGKCVCDSDARVGITLIKPEGLEQKPTASGHQYDYINYDHIKKGLKKASSELCHEDIHFVQKKMLDTRLEDPEKETCTPLQPDKKQMNVRANQSYGIVPATRESLSQEDNKAFLSSLGYKQVLQLLDSMKLGVYKPTFQQERITGDLLLELDEGVLEEELGIQSRIHRIKIMKVITGQYSAKEFLAESTVHRHCCF